MARKTQDDGSLKRLGGGRWQTRDERFTIEPQSGTWVVLDAEQSPHFSLKVQTRASESAGGSSTPKDVRLRSGATLRLLDNFRRQRRYGRSQTAGGRVRPPGAESHARTGNRTAPTSHRGAGSDHSAAGGGN